MYVKNYTLLKDNLVTLQPEESISSALDKIKKGDFLSLPVLEGNKFIGILMKETIYRNYFESEASNREEFLNNTKVKDLCKTDVETIQEDDYIENASYLLNELRTPFLPVLDDKGEFKGILTHRAIFNAFFELFGLNKGTKIVLNVYDIPGQIAKLTEIIRKANINILNFAVMDAKVMDVYRIIVRVDTTEVDELIDKIEKAGFKVSEVK